MVSILSFSLMSNKIIIAIITEKLFTIRGQTYGGNHRICDSSHSLIQVEFQETSRHFSKNN